MPDFPEETEGVDEVDPVLQPQPVARGRRTPIYRLAAIVLELVEVLRGTEYAGEIEWDERLGNDLKPALEELLRSLRS